VAARGLRRLTRLQAGLGDREGLLLEIALRFVDQLAAELLPLTSREGSAREVLQATMEAYLGLIERDTNLYRFLSDNAGTEKRDIITRLIAEEVAVVLERRLTDAGLDGTAGRPWAYGLVGMVHFAGDWWSEEKPVPRAVLVERLMTLAWDGLGSLEIDERTPTPSHRRDTRPQETT
jgi:AcrR family transcriptional regulator